MSDHETHRIFNGVVPDETVANPSGTLVAVSEGLVVGLQASALNDSLGQLPLISKEAEVITSNTKRVPKRILHFSDGILEEFSSDEEDATDASTPLEAKPNAQALLNPENLTWGPYVWYQVTRLGATTLSACDYLGEHLAYFFGITSPKYQFEINEYLHTKAREEERQKQDVEMAGWKDTHPPSEVNDSIESESVATVQPSLDRERY